MIRHSRTALACLGLLLPALAPQVPAQTNQWLGSQNCRSCHGHFYQLWSTSFHGLAMQPFTPELAKTKLTPQLKEVIAGRHGFQADLNTGSVFERSSTNQTRYPITQVMGGKDVFYFLTPLDRGRLQVLPVAYDVRHKEWFDTTVSAMRHFGDHPDQALYWKERPLTFNSSCFNCHVSQLTNNYDLATDSYHTTWAEPGINCETCHGPGSEHARLFSSWPTNQPVPTDVKLVTMAKMGTARANDLCASCHAKMSPLTQSFAPGEGYFDHFDLVTYEHPDFYPDGRDLGENYTFTQWRVSPCAKFGQLDCLHCHTSSGRYRFTESAHANDACLPCHESLVKTASAHSHHQPGSTGNQCVACHLPTTEFARMRRSDHSMRPPTPATTLAYNSPNACNLCHTNSDAAWADQQVRQWYKQDYQKPVLERAGLIAAARKGDWTKLPAILTYLADPKHEEIQTASLVRLLAGCDHAEKWPALRHLAADRSPLVRASAAEALGEHLNPENLAVLAKAATDDCRLVRVRAAAGLDSVPEERLPTEQREQVRRVIGELVGSLKARPDDSGSHANLGNLFLARGQAAQAVTEFETALRLEPGAVPVLVNAALGYNGLGQNDKAESCLRRALHLDPTNVVANLNLGMLLGELGKVSEAEQAFRAAFRTDPHSAQAAYNLGVILSKTDPAQSLIWCRRAAELAPGNPQYGYTYAFYLYQGGHLDESLKAIRRVRQAHPEDQDSALLEKELLSQISRANAH